MMTEKPNSYRTATGRVLSDGDTERMADEVARNDFDVSAVKRRRRRPPMGDRAADIVPVRVDPDLAAALDVRAEREHRTRSEVMRRALREYLAS
jgi:hypothetical protein